MKKEKRKFRTFLLEFFQDLWVSHCDCGDKAVVQCYTWNKKKLYLCSNCLRSVRFREKDFFEFIKPWGKYK